MTVELAIRLASTLIDIRTANSESFPASANSVVSSELVVAPDSTEFRSLSARNDDMGDFFLRPEPIAGLQ